MSKRLAEFLSALPLHEGRPRRSARRGRAAGFYPRPYTGRPGFVEAATKQYLFLCAPHEGRPYRRSDAARRGRCFYPRPCARDDHPVGDHHRLRIVSIRAPARGATILAVTAGAGGATFLSAPCARATAVGTIDLAPLLRPCTRGDQGEAPAGDAGEVSIRPLHEG